MDPIPLVETDIRSPSAKSLAIASSCGLDRSWLLDSPVCEQLAAYRILHLGIGEMPSPFRIVRTRLAGSYFLASLEGEGRVLVEGKWLASQPGHAFLLPPGTMNAFFTPEGQVWRFCWIRFQEATGEPPVARANSPVLSRFDGGPLEMAILGMRRECVGSGSVVLLEEWLRLIRSYVQAFASPNPAASELWRLWEEVANQLESPWRVSELAARLHLSEKQFQRVCLRDLGRTPRQHLMWLRMRHAAAMLLHTDRKISSIASSVGYRNPFVFASTFKRVMGWTPSDYQRHHRHPENAPSVSHALSDGAAS